MAALTSPTARRTSCGSPIPRCREASSRRAWSARAYSSPTAPRWASHSTCASPCAAAPPPRGCCRRSTKRSERRLKLELRAAEPGCSAGRASLAQQRAGGALEDPAPRADLPGLGVHLVEHLAHALGRDLDPVAFGHFLVALVFARQVLGDRLEAVSRDLHARGEVHHRSLEHQLVGGLGLDQDDIHPRVALLPTLCELMQALVCDQLEGLVADLREAHVRDTPATRPAQRAHSGLEVVDEGHN